MDDILYGILDDIVEQCNIIFNLKKRFGDDIEDFLSDDAYNMSCTFALMQIGESVKKIDSLLNERCEGVDWNAICRFRDLVAHHYGKVSKKIVWNIICEDIPVLYEEIERLRHH